MTTSSSSTSASASDGRPRRRGLQGLSTHSWVPAGAGRHRATAHALSHALDRLHLGAGTIKILSGTKTPRPAECVALAYNGAIPTPSRPPTMTIAKPFVL